MYAYYSWLILHVLPVVNCVCRQQSLSEQLRNAPRDHPLQTVNTYNCFCYINLDLCCRGQLSEQLRKGNFTARKLTTDLYYRIISILIWLNHIILVLMLIGILFNHSFFPQAPVNYVCLHCVTPSMRALSMAMSTVSIHIFGDVPSSPLVGVLQVCLDVALFSLLLSVFLHSF